MRKWHIWFLQRTSQTQKTKRAIFFANAIALNELFLSHLMRWD